MSDEKEKLLLYSLEGYAPPINHALACLEEARERTLLTVADLSAEMLDSYAEGFPNSIGSLLYHIAGIELDWLFSEILEQDFPENLLPLFPVDARDETGKLSVVADAELPDHLQRLAKGTNSYARQS